MRLSVRPLLRLLPLIASAAAVGACAGSATSPSAVPSVDTSDSWLRAVTVQAISPASRFAVGPTAVISKDGTYVTAGPVDASHKDALLPTLIGRSISNAGRDAILAEAGRLGLLGGKTDLRGVGVMPGGMTGRLQLTVKGAPVTLTGEPDSKFLFCAIKPCDPLPGTPEAFGELWRKLADPAGWLAADLGPEAPYVADAYALLVGPASSPDAGAGAQVQDWPLDVPLATFGRPVSNGTLRCGIVAGADAEKLRPALQAANRSTRWVPDANTNATFGLVVRPVIAGENPCLEAFGPG
jgi:hypothetical protein